MALNTETCFNTLSTGCVCYPNGAGCFCSNLEKSVRAYAYTERDLPELKEDQREFLKKEAVWAGEGLFKESDFEGISDKEYCLNVMEAWSEYASSNCY